MYRSGSPSRCLAVLLPLAAVVALQGCDLGGANIPSSPQYTYEFYEVFNGDSVNPERWVVHGDSVSVADGMLRIVSSRPWETGVESVKHFFRPRGDGVLGVCGEMFSPADSLRAISIAHIQDHWRSDDPDCYFFEFVRNDEFPGDNRVYFGARIDGVLVEYVTLGSFGSGQSVFWSLWVYEDYSVAGLVAGRTREHEQRGASTSENHHWVGPRTRTYTTYAKVYDLGLSLHGSGAATYCLKVQVKHAVL
jgi:hypothetical protein